MSNLSAAFLNEQLMVTAAHRYCLGRSSYIVGACIDWLNDNWDTFSEQTKLVCIRDTIEALMDDMVGGAMDREGWYVFARDSYNKISKYNKARIRNAVAYKEKEFPFND